MENVQFGSCEVCVEVKIKKMFNLEVGEVSPLFCRQISGLLHSRCLTNVTSVMELRSNLTNSWQVFCIFVFGIWYLVFGGS